jgi:Mg2+/Co2+ transporter CorB
VPGARRVIATLLAIFLCEENGPWAACLGAGAILLVFADYFPRTVAQRYPDAVLAFGNTLLAVPLKIVYPFAWLFSRNQRPADAPVCTQGPSGAAKRRRLTC